MGSSQSFPGLTEDLLEDYKTLTYLSKGEILYIMKKFYSIDPEKVNADFNHRFHKDDIKKKFETIRVNPFSDRIFQVFSSQRDECFSFEDLLDLCSVMSAECPPHVKAEWAFRIFDLDDDNQISAEDLNGMIDRLLSLNENTDRRLDVEARDKITQVILKEVNLDGSGSISLNEFKYIISRLPEFETSFYFRL